MKTVYRVCYSYLGTAADAEDATQSVFMKLVNAPREFDGEEHERAWLIRCAVNHCKDVLKSPRRTRAAEMPVDVVDERVEGRPGATDDTLDAVMRLPDIYRECVYLHYYEGYRTDEIAEMVDVPPSTVRNRLSKARALLREALGGDDDGR